MITPTQQPDRVRGAPLGEGDYAALANSWIDREWADLALLRRGDSAEGAEMVGKRDNGSYSGIVFPYIWPRDEFVRDYWLRRDRPDMEPASDGSFREIKKYLGPPGRSNFLYFYPGTSAEALDDTSIPIAVTEGAKKTIALARLSCYKIPDGGDPRFVAVGISGVWNWRGVIGKQAGPDGARRDVKGLIPDLNRIQWRGRKVYVVFDRNVATNSSVQAARKALTTELQNRGAEVLWVQLPTDGRKS
jgi:hypothetical protein